MPEISLRMIDNDVTIALLAVAIVASAYILSVYFTSIRRVLKRVRECQSERRTGAMPPLSVIVYDRDSTEWLEQMLPALLSQDYPAPYEVIVATDGRSTMAEGLVTRLSHEYTNLRLTYVPDEAHALSRKKLAMTLGVKGARYEHVVFTDANIAVPSARWLSAIGRRFAQGATLVIGTSHPAQWPHGLGIMNRYDVMSQTVTRLSASVKGRPYCGDEVNMAFDRRLFFDACGFSDSAGYHFGIDDIFLSHIARHAKVTTELSTEANVGVQCGDASSYYRNLRLQHLFTGRHVSRLQRLLMGLASLMMWLWIGATIALGLTGWPDVTATAISLVAGVTWLTLSTIAWARTSAALLMPMRWYAILPAMLLHPLLSLRYRLASMRSRSSNYTWAKQ